MANFTPQQIEEFLQEFFDVVGARQYVGARYVPIFGRAGEDTIEWDDGAPYEPLTVVMHEGISYVSRRYVPRGIQITDTAYWVETYRFDAQVEQYRQEVLSFDGRIQANADAIQGEAEARQQADDDVLMRVHDEYVPFPDAETYPKYGTAGQVLSTLADGTTKWEDPVTVDADIAEPLIEAWLDEHPEATTTVEDGAITYAKFADTVMDTNTRVVPAPLTRVTASDSGNVATGTLTDGGYWDVSLVVNNVAGYFVMAIYGLPTADYIDKKISVIAELVSGAGNVTVRLGVSSGSDWSPAANPATLLNTVLSSSTPITGRTITLRDVYTPGVGQGQIGFWLGITTLPGSGITTGTYQFRLYLVENVSAHTGYADYANYARSAYIAPNSVPYACLDSAARNTLSRVIPPVATNIQSSSSDNPATLTLASSGYMNVDLEVGSSTGHFALSNYGHTLADYIDKKLTLILEYVSGSNPIRNIRIGVSALKDWAPNANPLLLMDNRVLSADNPIIATDVTLRDVYTPASGQTTLGFFLGVTNFGTTAHGTYKFRFYVVENVSIHTTHARMADTALYANTADALSSTVHTADILFWGDSLTYGSGGSGVSFPGVCGTILGKTILNCGVGGESANTIAARQGGNSLVIPAGPINGTYNNGTLFDTFGVAISPLRQGNGANSGNVIYVNNEQCTLSISQTSSTSDDAVYTISGYSGGTSPVPLMARFRGCDYDAPVTVIWVGTNGAQAGSAINLPGRIAVIDSMIAHLHNTNYVILGLSRYDESMQAAEDQTLLEKYGAKFFPTRRMLVNYGMALQGLTPTAQDTEDISAGIVPTSLRSDSVHLNADGYEALGKMIANKITALGYFKD